MKPIIPAAFLALALAGCNPYPGQTFNLGDIRPDVYAEAFCRHRRAGMDLLPATRKATDESFSRDLPEDPQSLQTAQSLIRSFCPELAGP